MGQWSRIVANVLGIVRVVLAILPIGVLLGSGWELLALILALPGLASGVLLLAGGRRIDRSPGVATICFALAAVLGVMATDAGLPLSGGGGLVSLLLGGVLVLAPFVLAAITFRAYLTRRRTASAGAASGS